MIVTLPNIEKITLSTLWLSKVMDPQSWLFLALASNFGKFSNLATVLFLDSFRSYLEELLLIQLSLTLENFIAKYQKVCEIPWAKLGTKWKNLKSGVSLSPRLPMTAVKICVENFFTYSLWYGKLTIQNSQMVHIKWNETQFFSFIPPKQTIDFAQDTIEFQNLIMNLWSNNASLNNNGIMKISEY